MLKVLLKPNIYTSITVFSVSVFQGVLPPSLVQMSPPLLGV